jgi:hypothetical protein
MPFLQTADIAVYPGVAEIADYAPGASSAQIDEAQLGGISALAFRRMIPAV